MIPGISTKTVEVPESEIPKALRREEKQIFGPEVAQAPPDQLVELEWDDEGTEGLITAINGVIGFLSKRVATKIEERKKYIAGQTKPMLNKYVKTMWQAELNFGIMCTAIAGEIINDIRKEKVEKGRQERIEKFRRAGPPPKKEDRAHGVTIVESDTTSSPIITEVKDANTTSA